MKAMKAVKANAMKKAMEVKANGESFGWNQRLQQTERRFGNATDAEVQELVELWRNWGFNIDPIFSTLLRD